MNIIEVFDLCFGYSKNEMVLKNVSFNIKQGEYVSILGHNGSGKSTLAKLLIGLLKSSSGSIIIDSLTLNDENIYKIRSKTSMVFQNPDNQFIGSTVENDIAFGLENKQIPHEEMKDIILEFSRKVGMENFLDKEPNYLSGGQKQRVAIAGALALKPSILILDEAMSMLDPKGKKDISGLIYAIRKTNKDLTIISITHDVDEALQSDKIFVLSNGEMLCQGTPDEVFSNKEILEKSNLTQPFLYKIKTQLSDLGYSVKECKNLDDLVDKICQ